MPLRATQIDYLGAKQGGVREGGGDGGERWMALGYLHIPYVPRVPRNTQLYVIFILYSSLFKYIQEFKFTVPPCPV